MSPASATLILSPPVSLKSPDRAVCEGPGFPRDGRDRYVVASGHVGQWKQGEAFLPPCVQACDGLGP